MLNYSTPILINWDVEFKDDSLSAGGSHLGKIPGLSKYLNALGPEQDQDLVLIVDGYDTWFQLRPEILLARYHAINERANRRIAQRMPNIGSQPQISQKIVFSAQKLCWPHRPDEMACFAAPPSTLPSNIFGPDTDVYYPYETNPYLHTRQRYMNSGLIMGPVKELRHFFDLAKKHMVEDQHLGSDQGVFSDLVGAQEYQRELLRSKYLTYSQRFLYSIRRVLGLRSEFEVDRDKLLTFDSARETMEMSSDPTQAEIKLGLDYGSELSHATVFAERDADWVFHSAPKNASTFWHIKSQRIGQLPNDLALSKPPLRALEGADLRSEDEVNGRRLWRVETKALGTSDSTWQNIPLYTHLWTGIVPVSIHHNAWQNSMKTLLRQSFWPHMWWQPHASFLLKAHINGPRRPVIRDTGLGEWWSPVERKGGVETDNGTWIGWKDLCGKSEKELFHKGRKYVAEKPKEETKEKKPEDRPKENSAEKSKEEKHEERPSERPAEQKHEEKAGENVGNRPVGESSEHRDGDSRGQAEGHTEDKHDDRPNGSSDNPTGDSEHQDSSGDNHDDSPRQSSGDESKQESQPEHTDQNSQQQDQSRDDQHQGDGTHNHQQVHDHN